MAESSALRKDGTIEKKGHVCPPSTATHPKDRWETAFVYAFILRFAQSKSKIDSLNTAMDLEDALLTPPGTTNQLLQDILTRFVLLLRPQVRNIKQPQLMATLSNLLSDFYRTTERSVFWDDTLKANIDPLANLEGGFWAADWDLKLKILRQLVEYQLSHSPQIKENLDRAWGVKQTQHKKRYDKPNRPEEEDSQNQNSLLLSPAGMDSKRRRYWIVDTSPRVYQSSNPWKVSSSFTAISSDRDEYVGVINGLKETAPQENDKSQLKSKFDIAHIKLMKLLESRLEAIDAELARLERARKKLEQRNLLLVQAEVRGPRTRRQAQRPDYVYHDGISDDDGQDEYKYEDEGDIDQDQYDDFGNEEADWGGTRLTRQRRTGRDIVLRRSTRQSTNGKRKSSQHDGDINEWRGERRSRRLGATIEMDVDAPVRKRSRTAESSETGSTSAVLLPDTGTKSTDSEDKKFRVTGAAALKGNEIAVDSLQGKKKNKYWFYAVEPLTGSRLAPMPSNDEVNGSIEENHTVPRNRYRRIVDSPDSSEMVDSGADGTIAKTSSRDGSAPMSLASEE